MRTKKCARSKSSGAQLNRPADVRKLESLWNCTRQIEAYFKTESSDPIKAPEDLWQVFSHRLTRLREGQGEVLSPDVVVWNVESVVRVAQTAEERRDAASLSALMAALERILERSVRDSDWLVAVNHTDRPVDVQRPRTQLVFVLENIRSAFNVGSILRTADALGLEAVYCCGYTPNGAHRLVQKTALGAESSVCVVPKGSDEICNFEECIQNLKASGYEIVAFETSPQSVKISEIKFINKTAFIFGNERFGLSQTALKLADRLCQIPMLGAKNSLNVGVCAAVAGFEWQRQKSST